MAYFGTSQSYYANGALVKSKTKVMITGLPPSMTSKQLTQFFNQYQDSGLVRCESGGNGTGYAIFSDEQTARNAIDAGIYINDTKVNMRFAMRMTDNEQSSLFINQGGSKFSGKNSFKTFNNNGKDVKMFNNMPALEDPNNAVYGGFGGGRAVEQSGISFGNNNGNGLSINLGDDSNVVFGNRIKKSQRIQNLKNLNSNVISSREAFEMIDKFIGPKERYVLILGELDFSFSLSIIRSLGHGHNVISTSLHSRNDDQQFKFSVQNKISNNVNNIFKFRTQYNNKKSIVFRGFNGLKLRESLIRKLGNDIGSIIGFDKIIFSMPFHSGSNHFDIRNLVFLKKLFQNVNDVVVRHGDVKPELHLLMPIFSTRSQFESYKIEEIGKYCNLKWRLKTVRIFDWEKLDIAFNGYIARNNHGIRLNQNRYRFNRYENSNSDYSRVGYNYNNSRYRYNNNYNGNYNNNYNKQYRRTRYNDRYTYRPAFQYIGYYILETI